MKQFCWEYCFQQPTIFFVISGSLCFSNFILAMSMLSLMGMLTSDKHIQQKNIHYKIKQNNAIITQTDKGKTIVVIYKKDYHNKIYTFLTDNKFQAIPNNSTNKYQKQITQAIKQRNLIFNKEQIKHLTQRNPMPPTLKSQLKLHKAGNPIRPVINDRSAPSYKVAKQTQ